jgi:hypothetical protein
MSVLDIYRGGDGDVVGDSGAEKGAGMQYCTNLDESRPKSWGGLYRLMMVLLLIL